MLTILVLPMLWAHHITGSLEILAVHIQLTLWWELHCFNHYPQLIRMLFTSPHNWPKLSHLTLKRNQVHTLGQEIKTSSHRLAGEAAVLVERVVQEAERRDEAQLTRVVKTKISTLRWCPVIPHRAHPAIVGIRLIWYIFFMRIRPELWIKSFL